MITIPQTDGNSAHEGDATESSISVSPFYYSSVNEITQPNSYTACSHYLTRRWKRELGPNGYAILTSFRDRCFYNRRTGELRDVIQIPIPEIAEECGLSEKTVRRELAGNRALQRFVRPQREPVLDARRGGWRWGQNTYKVAMDDPIHPDDEQQLIEIVRRKAEAAEKSPEDPLARARRLATSGQSVSALGQIVRAQGARGPQRSDNLTERRDNLTSPLDKLSTTSGQSDRTLKSLDSSLLEKTSLTPAAPGDSLSLFSEGETPASSEERSSAAGEDVATVRAAIHASRRSVATLQEVETEWKAMPPEDRERFRAEAVRQWQGKGHATPTDKMVEPTMFRLYWAERKRLVPVPAIYVASQGCAGGERVRD